MKELTTSAREKPLLLIADDDSATRLLLEHLCTYAGFDAVTARDGIEALEKFHELQPDCLLLDIKMPRMDGFNVCEAIRMQEREIRTPIVMITGQNDIESVARAYEIGANDYLSKPFDPNTLPHRLRQIMRSSVEHNSLQGLLEGLPDAIAVLDDSGRIMDLLNADSLLEDADNANVLGLINDGDFFSRQLKMRFHGKVRQALRGNAVQHLEFQLDSSERYFEARLVRRDKATVLAIVRDVTDRMQSEQRIHELAYFDTLTGLPNREQLKASLEKAITDARASGQGVALIHLDLDRFKRINDTFGHSVGDVLLCAVADRVRHCVSQNSSADSLLPLGTQIARLAGDEFAIIVPEPSGNDVKELCDQIQRALTEPFTCEGHQVVVSSSMGVAHYPKHSDDAQQLLMKADTAMHRAKDEGANNVRSFKESMHAHFREHLELESELNGAIQRGEMMLHYQPKIDLRDWKVVGLEALIRWHHHERGWIPPGEFIRIAEETGQIIELGRWVLNEACRQISAWRNSRLSSLQIAINISNLQFTHDDLQRTIMEAVWANAVMPKMLELEITESVMVSNIDRTIEVLSALKSTGVSVSIDDFGTGYSSLSYLKRFPLDKLKIDRSFISDLHQNADDAAICSAIIAMAHQLGLTVVAEGVENEAQLNFLTERGCDQLQGFYIGAPLPAEELSSYFRNTLDPQLEKLRLSYPAAL